MPTRHPDGKLVANNTRQRVLSDGTIVTKLHGTDVVRKYPNGTWALNSGGWKTLTTKDRINRFSPACVYQRDYEWYLDDGTVFHDGIIVDNMGRAITGPLAMIAVTGTYTTAGDCTPCNPR